MITLLLVLALQTAPPPCGGAPIQVATLPASLKVVWDDATTTPATPTSYRVTVDANAPIIATPTKPSPCTDCASAVVPIGATGSHVVSVQGINASGPGPVTSCSVDVSVMIGLPLAPSNMRFTLAQSSTTDIPPADSLTDSTGAVWTFPSKTPCPDFPTQPASTCRQVLRNGQHYASAYGYALTLVRGVIYVQGTDAQGNWFMQCGTGFCLVGTVKPQ